MTVKLKPGEVLFKSRSISFNLESPMIRISMQYKSLIFEQGRKTEVEIGIEIRCEGP